MYCLTLWVQEYIFINKTFQIFREIHITTMKYMIYLLTEMNMYNFNFKALPKNYNLR